MRAADAHVLVGLVTLDDEKRALAADRFIKTGVGFLISFWLLGPPLTRQPSAGDLSQGER